MRYYEIPREEIDYFREEYEFLSNFYPTKVVFDEITYYNAEAAYQAQKCSRYEDRFQFALMSADEAKRLGQKIEIRPDWDDIKYHVMEQVVYAKLAQNPTLAQDLLDTGDKPLKEGNTWGDVYWGINLRTGEGENNLGKILITLRDYFCANGIPEITSLCDSLKGPFEGIWIDDAEWELVGIAPERFEYIWPGTWSGEYLRIPVGSSEITVTGTADVTIDPQWRTMHAELDALEARLLAAK